MNQLINQLINIGAINNVSFQKIDRINYIPDKKAGFKYDRLHLIEKISASKFRILIHSKEKAIYLNKNFELLHIWELN